MQYSQSLTFVHFHSSFFAKSQISSIRSFSFIFIIHKKKGNQLFFSTADCKPRKQNNDFPSQSYQFFRKISKL